MIEFAANQVRWSVVRPSASQLDSLVAMWTGTAIDPFRNPPPVDDAVRETRSVDVRYWFRHRGVIHVAFRARDIHNDDVVQAIYGAAGRRASDGCPSFIPLGKSYFDNPAGEKFVALFRACPPWRDPETGADVDRTPIRWRDVASAAFAARRANLENIAVPWPLGPEFGPQTRRRIARAPQGLLDAIYRWFDFDAKDASPAIAYDYAADAIGREPWRDLEKVFNPPRTPLQNILDILRPDLVWPEAFSPPAWTRPPASQGKSYPLFAAEEQADES